MDKQNRCLQAKTEENASLMEEMAHVIEQQRRHMKQQTVRVKAITKE